MFPNNPKTYQKNLFYLSQQTKEHKKDRALSGIKVKTPKLQNPLKYYEFSLKISYQTFCKTTLPTEYPAPKELITPISSDTKSSFVW